MVQRNISKEKILFGKLHISVKPVADLFIRFLINHDVYELYMENSQSESIIKEIYKYDFLKSEDAIGDFLFTFAWTFTDQGFAFWKDIYDCWGSILSTNPYCKKLKKAALTLYCKNELKELFKHSY